MSFDIGAISSDPDNCPEYLIDPALLKELKDQILEKGDGTVKRSHLRLKQLAMDVAMILEKAQRQGLPQDWPEGSCYITLSDTVARTLTRALRKSALANE